MDKGKRKNKILLKSAFLYKNMSIHKKRFFMKEFNVAGWQIEFDNKLSKPSKVKPKEDTHKVWVLLLLGLAIGFINGFWGGGGGMICVPALTLLLKMPDKEAHATTILIMLPLCISSFIVYMLKGALDWQISGVVTSGFVVGGLLGALALKNINNVALRLVFSLIIIAGGVRLLF